tara:strand:+ start:7113 stop:7634 length:522 start_codon:yes stop_codon:yes gene_type:complete
MKYFKVLLIIFFFINVYSYSFGTEIYFIDMKKILNESKAGKGAQEFLKNKLKDETKKFDKEQTVLKKEETDLISKKKLISPEEYKKKLNDLRKKNISHQKSRQLAANEIFKKREKARSELNKSLKPILEKYMSENNISVVIDKKSIVVAKTEIDLTDKILKLLDKDLKSINLK